MSIGLLNCRKRSIIDLTITDPSSLIEMLAFGVAQNCEEGDVTATFKILGDPYDAYAICQTDCPFIKRP